jgi:flagellar assembly protein FliH
LSTDRRRVFQAGVAVRPALFPSFDGDGLMGGAARSHESERSAPRDPDLDPLRAQAKAQGFEAGRLEGREAGRKAAHAEWNTRLQAVLTVLEGAARALSVRRLELATEVERRLPELALALGEKIVRQELRTSATAAQTVIRGLSDRIAGCGRAVGVRLAPQMVEAFEAWRVSGAASGLSANVRVEPDPTLAAGEWLLETDDGFLDGRIEPQLEAAWRTMSEMFDHMGGPEPAPQPPLGGSGRPGGAVTPLDK